MPKGKGQILYHCTQIDCGPDLTVRRRYPVIRAADEPKTPRLCASPTVAQCMSAALFSFAGPVYVYATPNPVVGVTPTKVWDAPVTWERWLLPGQRLVRVDVVSDALRADISAIPIIYHDARLFASFHSRIAHLLIIEEVAPHLMSKRLVRFVHRAAERLGVGCPYLWYSRSMEEKD